MIINITFRRKPWKFCKIYAIGGGVVEGVEDIITANELFQSDNLEVGQGTESFHPSLRHFIGICQYQF